MEDISGLGFPKDAPCSLFCPPCIIFVYLILQFFSHPLFQQDIIPAVTYTLTHPFWSVVSPFYIWENSTRIRSVSLLESHDWFWNQRGVTSDVSVSGTLKTTLWCLYFAIRTYFLDSGWSCSFPSESEDFFWRSVVKSPLELGLFLTCDQNRNPTNKIHGALIPSFLTKAYWPPSVG